MDTVQSPAPLLDAVDPASSSSAASTTEDMEMPNGNNENENTTASSTSSENMAVIPSTPPTKLDQLNLVKRAMMQRLEVGATVYLLPAKWFDAFTLWTRSAAGHPSRVDPLAVLCDQDGVVLHSAQEGRDYHIVNQEAWSLIQRWSHPSPPPSITGDILYI